MSEKYGWRGYIFSREIGGQIVPQRVQNLVIRNYAQKQGKVFLLSATEYYMDKCYMILKAIKSELNSLEGIIFYSLDLLPETLSQRESLFEQVLSCHCELHFALEELKIKQAPDVQLIEDILACRKLMTNSEQNIQELVQIFS